MATSNGSKTDKSLQINIDSEEDAKAVIQHLGQIKKTYDTLADTVGINSIEFCIAESIRRKVDGFLIGAIPWCRTYVKSVKPFEGNVHFPLPHFVPAVMPPPRIKVDPKTPNLPRQAFIRAEENELEDPKQKNRYLKNVDPADQAKAKEALASQLVTPGKSERPVPAQVAAG